MLGVACVLLGMVLMAVAFTAPDQTEVAASVSSTTSTSAPSALVPGIAPGTTAPLGNVGLGEGVAAETGGRTPLTGFGEVAVTITSGTGEVCKACLMSALTSAQRSRGLMEVTDPALGGYDGMLFEFPDEIAGSFWMRNTPLPLSIAYFAESGTLVSTTDMSPCDDVPDCPPYPADGSFRFALEVPEGTLSRLGVVGRATLRIDARRCPEKVAGS